MADIWTPEPPTVAGWYWWRAHRAAVVQAVYVLDGKALLSGLSSRERFDRLGGEWGGRVLPPDVAAGLLAACEAALVELTCPQQDTRPDVVLPQLRTAIARAKGGVA